MTDQFVNVNKIVPITPPPELVNQWLEDSLEDDELGISGYIATQAARWGADQELEACCEFLDDNELCDPNFHKDLRAVRRPKPPSLKEQALEAMGRCDSEMWCEKMEIDLAIIRTALESLPS